ncbi:hypothetical protein [endosymbiont of Ridgeia piscesae]|jgi:hypothetical protein|uniref:Uncharacterized protein n=1 Tax=endosymbiont of Ridgeia piscesae TaxID=54398 RepID=A0A0T5ZA75_9GAMM|nr:hypothetical protein [endosymbiont of Ridgeia piscesae]KRT54274.1 hypothetical protein Ga0074115_10435 [endosymbiont of Ridgeia piscesae]KRT59751.1 hypothetical protein Ga0076813_15986 [endosymbiont of Ridgeia piscesae]
MGMFDRHVKQQQTNRNVFFIVLIVLIGAVIWALQNAEQPPEKGITLTPKEYIELVERKKAARIEAQQLEQAAQERARRAEQTIRQIPQR